MSPAPRNPTPEGIAALIREASQPMGPSRKAKAELMVKRHDPSDTNAMVRIPATARSKNQDERDKKGQYIVNETLV